MEVRESHTQCSYLINYKNKSDNNTTISISVEKLALTCLKMLSAYGYMTCPKAEYTVVLSPVVIKISHVIRIFYGNNISIFQV